MSVPREQQRALLLRVARHAMSERGFEVDFSTAVLAEVQCLSPAVGPYGDVRARPAELAVVLDR